MKQIDAEYLRRFLHYDRLTGVFTWLVSPSFNVLAGSDAGRTKARGYVEIGFEGEIYQASHLAWLLETGEWPNGQIDHEDGFPGHNWFDNLREATS